MNKIYFKELVPNDDYSAPNIEAVCEDITDFFHAYTSEDDRFYIYSEMEDVDNDIWRVQMAANIEIRKEKCELFGNVSFGAWYPIEKFVAPTVKEAMRKALTNLNSPERLRFYEAAYMKYLQQALAQKHGR